MTYIYEGPIVTVTGVPQYFREEVAHVLCDLAHKYHLTRDDIYKIEVNLVERKPS